MMKKSVVGVLSMVTILGLAGCQTENKSNNPVTEQSNTEEQTIIEGALQTTAYFGKVEKMVGNEITMKLSDDEFVVGEGSEQEFSYELTEEDISKLESGGVVQLPDGSVMAQATVDSDYDPDSDPGISMEQLVEEGFIEEGEGFLGDTSELTFNGETKSLIVPAGVSILNLMNGKLGTLSDIKEGSIISVIMDNETNTILSVDIMG